ncbi:MAG TPA: hypothetical protein IAC19_05000 [Candidatus Ventricola gallistercoris]|nr:hypothetical protein [Candidatus Ventricola gallistercoris]
MTICLFFRAVHAERMVAGMRDASSPYALKIRSGLNPQQTKSRCRSTKSCNGHFDGIKSISLEAKRANAGQTESGAHGMTRKPISENTPCTACRGAF